jgi:hypothetical protein
MLHVGFSWIAKLTSGIFGPVYQFYFNQPRLYIFTDRILRDIVPVVPYKIDEIEWKGDVVIKNNSKYDAYNLEIIDSDNLPAFDSIEKLPKYNHLSSKTEIKLKFSWKRHYAHETTGLRIRSAAPGEYRFPLDKQEFIFTLQYDNEKGKHFYSQFKKGKNGEITAFSIFRPKT